MVLQIAILEDDPRRRLEMDRCLSERLPMYDALYFDMPSNMNRWLENNLANCVIVSLDHDLNRVTESLDHLDNFVVGDGLDVARFLSKHSPTCPVILHSTNRVGRNAMQDALSQSGWETQNVDPYGDLLWIGERWFPKIMELLRKNRR